MSEWPPPYPRVPLLWATRAGDRDDLVLAPEQARALLAGPVVVEEKLDGANVMLWREGATVHVATRAGAGGRDRARQLGPLRAWAAERADKLRELLGDERVLYGEWLWLGHGVRYEELPDYFVGLDVFHRDGTWFSLAQRDAALLEGHLVAPPRILEGIIDADVLPGLLAHSRFGSAPAEGIILRRTKLGGGPRLAKLLAPGFARRTDDEWQRPERNALLALEAARPTSDEMAERADTRGQVRRLEPSEQSVRRLRDLGE